MVSQVLALADNIPEWLPPDLLRRHKLVSLGQAIKKIHFPGSLAEIEIARTRLAFNELFLLQLQSVISKMQLRSSRADPIIFKEKDTKAFVSSLPFTLTAAQKKAAWEILRDIGKDRPMARLLEGDVGMWIRSENVRVGRVMPLLDKDGRNACPPLLFDGSQDS